MLGFVAFNGTKFSKKSIEEKFNSNRGIVAEGFQWLLLSRDQLGRCWEVAQRAEPKAP